MLGLARYLNLDIDCLAKSLLQLLTSITNRTTVNIHDEPQTKILASAHPVTQPRQEAEHFWYNGKQHWILTPSEK